MLCSVEILLTVVRMHLKNATGEGPCVTQDHRKLRHSSYNAGAYSVGERLKSRPGPVIIHCRKVYHLSCKISLLHS